MSCALLLLYAHFAHHFITVSGELTIIVARAEDAKRTRGFHTQVASHTMPLHLWEHPSSCCRIAVRQSPSGVVGKPPKPCRVPTLVFLYHQTACESAPCAPKGPPMGIAPARRQRSPATLATFPQLSENVISWSMLTNVKFTCLCLTCTVQLLTVLVEIPWTTLSTRQ